VIGAPLTRLFAQVLGSRRCSAFHTAALRTVRAGPGLDLNLGIASSVFGIHRRKDHADFADEIGFMIVAP
jgi:hypothetical protein